MKHISEVFAELLDTQPMKGQMELFFCDEVNSEFVAEVPC